MRRTIPTIPTILAISLLAGASPILAQDEESATDVSETQRIETPAFGIALSFPADWRVSLPEGERVSALTNADGEPVMETTLIYANGGNGTVCDVDAYLDMPADSELEPFAFQLVTYLQQNEGADSAMVVGETEVAAGPAYRIEIFDQATGHIRAIYVFDGPARDDGAFERYMLTCAAREAGEPFWEPIAESAEFFEPVPAEDEGAAEEEVPADSEEAVDEAAAEDEGADDEETEAEVAEEG